MISISFHIDVIFFPCKHLGSVPAYEKTWAKSGQTLEGPWQRNMLVTVMFIYIIMYTWISDTEFHHKLFWSSLKRTGFEGPANQASWWYVCPWHFSCTQTQISIDMTALHCIKDSWRENTHTHIYIYACVCVCIYTYIYIYTQVYALYVKYMCV